MAFVDFEPQYHTGISAMDAQHERLIDLINRLYEAMRSGRASDASGQILAELMDYAHTHFSSEEVLLEKMGYPNLANHKEVHTKLLQEAADYQRQYQTGKINAFFLLNFLKNWLMTHIADHDVAYGEFDRLHKEANGSVQSAVTMVDDKPSSVMAISHGLRASSRDFSEIAAWFFSQIVGAMTADVWMALIDDQGIFRHVHPSDKFPIPVEVGATIQDKGLNATITAKAFLQKKRFVEAGDVTLFGFEYTAIATPITDFTGTFAGIFTIVTAASHQKELRQGIIELDTQFSTLDVLAHDLAQAGTESAEVTDRIAQRTLQLRAESEAMKGINDLIREVASQTNLLGLNAAIEAARAGDLGRGFGVVASEIRRLADTVKSSAQEIASRIESTQQQVREISDLTQGGMAASEEQAAQLQELSASIATVYQVMKDLKQLAQ